MITEQISNLASQILNYQFQERVSADGSPSLRTFEAFLEHMEHLYADKETNWLLESLHIKSNDLHNAIIALHSLRNKHTPDNQELDSLRSLPALVDLFEEISYQQAKSLEDQWKQDDYTIREIKNYAREHKPGLLSKVKDSRKLAAEKEGVPIGKIRLDETVKRIYSHRDQFDPASHEYWNLHNAIGEQRMLDCHEGKRMRNELKIAYNALSHNANELLDQLGLTERARGI